MHISSEQELGDEKKKRREKRIYTTHAHIS